MRHWLRVFRPGGPMAAGGARSALMTVGLTAAVGWGSRILAALAQLLAVRMLIQLLGVSGYGLFAIVIGLLNWFALTDLGFGAGLQNLISSRRVAGVSPLPAIRAICMLLLLLLLAFSLLWLGISRWAGPVLLQDLGQVTPGQAGIIFLGFAIVATGTGLASVGLKICFAEHRGYIAHLLTLAGTLTGVAALQLIHFVPAETRIIWSLILYQGPLWLLPTIFLVRYIWVTRRSLPWAGVRRSLSEIGAIWPSARIFLLFGLLGASVLNIDYIILSQVVSAEDVAVYAVFARVFYLIFFVFSAVTQAFWPIMAEYIENKEIGSLRLAIKKCLGFGVVVVISGSAVFYLSIDIIEDVLFKNSLKSLPAMYILLFALYWLIRVWTDTYATVIQSGGKTAFLCASVAVQATVNFGTSYLGAVKYGVPGLMIGMSAAFLLTVAWMLPLYVYRYMASSESDEQGIRT